MGKDGLTKLQRLRAAELSIVDWGANKKRRFPITKAEGKMDEILKAVLDVEHADEAQLVEVLEKAKANKKASTAAKAALRILGAFKEEMPEDVMSKLAAMLGVKKTEDGYILPKACKTDDVKKFLADLPEDVRKALEPDPDAGDGEEEDVMKGLTPEAQEIFKAQDDKIAALEATLKKERDDRELAEWTEKAEKHLSHFPGKNSEELGTMLKSLHDVDPKLAESQFESMKAASDGLKTSGVLKSVGHGADGEDLTAEQELVKKAEGIVEKSEKPLTKEQAFRKACELNPDLYEKYLTQNPRQVAQG